MATLTKIEMVGAIKKVLYLHNMPHVLCFDQNYDSED